MNERRTGFAAISIPNSNDVIVIGGFNGQKTLN
jgi:hypothetical protein